MEKVVGRRDKERDEKMEGTKKVKNRDTKTQLKGIRKARMRNKKRRKHTKKRIIDKQNC